MKSNSSVTISIPAYNDMHAVRNLMQEFHQAGIEGPEIFYLLIDDGSQDNTAESIRELSQIYSNTSCIFHQKNQGFGYTISEAIKTPETDYILFISGDHQFKAEAALILLSEIGNDNDYTLGKRMKRNDNTYRRVVSKIYNQLISLLTGQKVNDINSIFLVKRQALESLSFQSKSAFIHAEIFLKLKNQKKTCREVSIPHHPRIHGKGSGGKLSVLIPTFIDMIKFVFKSKVNHH